MGVPIALLVDDSTPFVHLYRHHIKDLHRRSIAAADGRELGETIPYEFLGKFCELAGRHGMAGKFSIVPAPMGAGDVVEGVAGFGPERTREWIESAKTGLGGRFDFSPEMLTHSWAVDLKTGKQLRQNEEEWAAGQDRNVLADYITRALELLKQAGVDATGVTSPWMLGEKVEEEYIWAIVEAQRRVHGRSFSWYFLHVRNDPATKPWVARRDSQATLVSIASGMDDMLWDTIWRYGRMERTQIARIADAFLSSSGRRGKIRDVIDGGGWPIILAHWQSIYSNGLESGLAVLDEVGRRVRESLGDEVEWMSCMEMSRLTAGEKA